MTPAPFIVFCVIEAKGNWVLTSSVRTVVAMLGLVAALSASAADYKILEIRPGMLEYSPVFHLLLRASCYIGSMIVGC